MAKKTGKKSAKKKAAKKPGAKKTAKRAGKKSNKTSNAPSKESGATKRGAKKRGAKKQGAKKQGAKKAGKAEPKHDPLAPRPIGSGRGATPDEIGRDLVAMINAGRKEDEIWAKWFSPKLVSIEGGQMNMAWHGMKAVRAKSDWWYSAHRVHSIQADGPYVGATGFGVRYSMDVEEIASGRRWQGDELAFYSVLNGKVVQEEFMGKPMADTSAPNA